MSMSPTSDQWWKNGTFYCLDVETYFDGNGDGVGDFDGLAQRIDYLAGIGITTLWLMPFFPSPDKATATTSELPRRHPDWATRPVRRGWCAPLTTAASGIIDRRNHTSDKAPC